MATTTALSEHVRQSVEREREVVSQRLAGLQDQAARVRAVADALEADAAETARLLRNIDEMLGLAPQLSLDGLHGELRGQKLQQIAVELLRQRRGAGAVVHYREWFDLLLHAGIKVGGRDPLATFLTQIGRAPGVESVRPRSGLYRLKTAF
jgi:hypothetical protein